MVTYSQHVDWLQVSTFITAYCKKETSLKSSFELLVKDVQETPKAYMLLLLLLVVP